jgi:hypothetical protein
MNEKQLFKVERKNPRWQDVAGRAIAAIKESALSGRDFQVAIGEVKRTLDQNAAMWPALKDFADQVPWPVTCHDGTTRQATPEEMKDVLTAAFEHETRMAPGLRGGFVMLGARTSQYGKRKMADFLTFLRAEGNERGVVWSEKARDSFDEYIPCQRAA